MRLAVALGTTEWAANGAPLIWGTDVKSDVAQDDPAVSAQAMDEAELVEQAQHCPQAFGPIYDLYYGKILGYIYRRTLDAGVAEELTSNTFFQALRALRHYEHRGHFAAWLYRIATNEINLYRRNAAHRHESNHQWQAELDRIWFVSPNPGTEEEVEEKMRSFAHLHAAVERLPEKYRLAISLRYFEAMPYAEIGEVMGKRLGTVKSLVHRGLKLLKRHCQHEPKSEGLLP